MAGVLHTGCRAPQSWPSHLTPLPPLLSHAGRGAGEDGGRVPYWWSRTAIPAPPPGLPPLGGGDKSVSPLGGRR
ncbi:MAG: hypothetical protein KatS3mg054_1474 [Chloroflexus sp.]|nr:MAG: hypothetical protein KatS3mg054_1474 [Chloroflexus sp.]GIV91346.1 MAG: hypothetical protein KatS3mg056_0055 [Chloroflexus sp.]